MDDVEQQQQLNTAPSSASGSTPRRSLAAIFGPSSKTPRRTKTPSVVITDETTILSDLSSRKRNNAANGGGVQETSQDGAAPSSTDSAGCEVALTSTAPADGALSRRQRIMARCCNERIRKIIWGVLIMTCVSAAWVGATHLLKTTFQTVQIIQVNEHVATSTASPVDSSPTANASSTTTSRPTTEQEVHQEDELRTLEYTYEASFLSTWLMTTWTLLFLPLYSVCCLVSRQLKPAELAIDIKDSALAFRDKGFTLGTFISRCLLFCFLWVGTNWMYMHALSILDATDVMALFATNVSFVYLLSWVILHDQFVGLRIVAVILCNTGIALLAYMDGITRSPTLGGVVLAAAASAGSAVYKVLFKRLFVDASYCQVSFFFSLIGIMNLVLLWPILLTLHFSGLEVIIWNRVPWMHLTIAGALSLVANLLGNFGPAFTYEVFIHLGLVIAIPVSAALDVTQNGVTFEGMKLAGTVLIVCGFLLVLFPENWPDYLTRLLRWGRHLNHHHQGGAAAAPVDLRTGYISRSHLRSPSGRVR